MHRRHMMEAELRGGYICVEWGNDSSGSREAQEVNCEWQPVNTTAKHPLCTHYAPTMHHLCTTNTHYAPTDTHYALIIPTMHY